MITARSKGRLAGFILLPVILLLAVIAAVALMMTQKGLVDSKQAKNSIDHEQARYTAEAILEKSEWLLKQNETCADYSVPASGEFADAGYSVALSQGSGSPVSVTVTSDDGPVITRQFKMYQTPVSTELTATGDTNIRESDKNTNYNSEGIKIKFPFFAFGNERRGLIHFDLSAIPAQAIISLAKLKLLLFQGSGLGENQLRVNVHEVTESWNFTEVTWSKRNLSQNWADGGGDFTSAVVASTVTDRRVGGYYEWDVVTLIKSWVNGSSTNNGMILIGEWVEGLQETYDFAEVESGDPLKRPKLILNYQCECGVVCPLPI